MNLNKKRSYPYSKTRVFMSSIMAILSMVLALTLLASDLVLLLYYLLSTSVLTIATLLLKTQIYPLINEQKYESEQDQIETTRTSWIVLLLTFTMLFVFLVVPLLLVNLLSSKIWVILIVSFTCGVSISEVFFYFLYTH